MRHIISLILAFSLAIAMVNAIDLTMKTNEVYTVHYQFNNVDDGDTLKDCVPYFSKDLEGKDFVLFQPKIFELASGETQDIVISIQEPPTGYYQDSFNVRCTRYVGNEFVGAGDVIKDPVQYDIVVVLAGVGQAYAITPSNQFYFLSIPPALEKADFQIVNTGSAELDVIFELPPEFPNIKIEPLRATIPSGKVQLFKVSVPTEVGFESLHAEIPVRIGDYGDKFIIDGKRESIATGSGAAVTSIAFGNVDINGTMIPSWVIFAVLAVAFYYVYKESVKKK